mmetsp:Transcript_7334/g.26695  ORF Transcript_7334/g.26695 Transcript_7334/m.26695 type:complete len:767 (+) Transcript_7334:96-2396(+)
MWARRCGVPPIWPSRVKVFLYSLATGTVGWTIYTFMASSNVGYLDLSRPSQDRVVCVASWPGPGKSTAESWWDEDSWDNWIKYQADTSDYLERYTCTVPSVANATCDMISVPLHQLQPTLGVPLRFGDGAYNWRRSFSSKDSLCIYAHLFLVLSICLWLAISFHDHALLHTVGKNYILDMRGLSREFPCFQQVCRYIMATSTIRSLLRISGRWYHRLAGILMAVLVAPVLLLWRFLLFMFVVCPLAGFLFVVFPIRTSRMWIFLICLVSMVYGLCLTIHMYIFVASDVLRPRYAVMWEAAATSIPLRDGPGSCMCGCPFPLSDTTTWRLFGIGVLATIKSFVLAFRCLKGLRRSNWANLMSVTFTIPVNAYSVEWLTPDGQPIKNRDEGQPVQSELAFDPFALMDEQPDSANTHLTLKPSPVMEWEVDESSGERMFRHTSKRHLLGPSAPILQDLEAAQMRTPMDITLAEYIGWCGFPYRTGGIQGRFNMVSEPDTIGSTATASSRQVSRRSSTSSSNSHGRPSAHYEANESVDLEAGIRRGGSRYQVFKCATSSSASSLPTPLAALPSATAAPGVVAAAAAADFSLPRIRLNDPAALGGGMPPLMAHAGGPVQSLPGATWMLASPECSPTELSVTSSFGREARVSSRLPPTFFPMVAAAKGVEAEVKELQHPVHPQARQEDRRVEEQPLVQAELVSGGPTSDERRSAPSASSGSAASSTSSSSEEDDEEDDSDDEDEDEEIEDGGDGEGEGEGELVDETTPMNSR